MPQAKGVTTLFRKPTQFPAGVGNARYKGDPKDRLGIPDPSSWNVFFDDFQGQTTSISAAASNGWAAAGGVGTPLGVQIPDAGTFLNTSGLYKLTTSAGATDSTTMQRHATLGQNFTFDQNRKFYMEIKCSLDHATLSDFGFGMVPASTSSLLTSQSDGFRIGKTTAVGTFQSDIFAASNTPKLTTSAMFGGTKVVANQMMILGMAYVGVAYGPGSYGPQPIASNPQPLTAVNFEFVFYLYQDNSTATVPSDGWRQQSVIVPSTSFSANTVGLMPSISTLNTSGVARNVTIDYVMVAQERQIA